MENNIKVCTVTNLDITAKSLFAGGNRDSARNADVIILIIPVINNNRNPGIERGI